METAGGFFFSRKSAMCGFRGIIKEETAPAEPDGDDAA
jgi:hypothetical protein